MKTSWNPENRKELLSELIAALEEDKELRYMLMGLLGFRELLERFARLEERFAALEERVTRLEERMVRVEESLEALNKTVITIANRFGVLSEYSFREVIKGIVEDLFGASAHRWTTYDTEGIVYGHPAVVEIDVVVTGSRHLLVEVKSRADTGDVLELVRIARLYEEKEGVKPELAIVAGFVTPKARELAEKLGVRVYTYLKRGELALI